MYLPQTAYLSRVMVGARQEKKNMYWQMQGLVL